MQNVFIYSFLIGLLTFSGCVNAQSIQAQLSSGAVINGPSPVIGGTVYQYSFDNGQTLPSSAYWTVDSKGTVTSSWKSGTIYYATVRWHEGGSSVLKFTAPDLLIPYGQKTITVTLPPVAVPNTTFTITQKCGKTVIKRSSSPPANTEWIWQTSATGTNPALGSQDSLVVTTSSSIYLRARNTQMPYNWSTSSQSVGSITVMSIPSAPASATDVTAFFGKAASLSVAAVTGATSYKWYTSPSGSAFITGATGASYTLTNVTATMSFYVSALNGSCESSTRRQVTATMEPLPIIQTVGNKTLTMGNPVVLTVPGTFNSYIWKNQANTVMGSSATLSVTSPGSYTVTVTKTSVTGAGTTLSKTIAYDAKGQNLNYVAATTIQTGGVTNATAVGALTATQKTVATQYYDGLGRPIQSVVTQGSPGLKDIVTPIVYDTYGREAKKYLPFTAESDGWYKPNESIIDANGNYAGIAQPFYATGSDNKIADDGRPYSESIIEASPLSRVEKQYGPGDAWGPAQNNKYVGMSYQVNVHNTAAGLTGEKIIAWKVNASGLPVRESVLTGYIVTGGYYNTGQLMVTVSKDEHLNEVREYKNKQDQVVLKKVQVVPGSTDLNNRDHWALTYYIYDDAGNLSFVLQPELSKIVHQNDTYVPTAANISALAFKYTYDNRNRMINKWIPGAGRICMIYDNRDRLVMTQDSVQKANKEWLYTKYDELNRPIITGLYTHSAVITRWQMSGLISTTNFSETYNGNASTFGYTNTVFPTSSTKVLTVTFYDGYQFVTPIVYNGNASDTTYNFRSTDIAGQETTYATNVTGQVTGSMVNILGTTTYLYTVNYFDNKSRVIQVRSGNHKGGRDRITNKYDFVRLKKSRSTSILGSTTHRIYKSFHYDHAGRLLKIWHRFNTQDSVLLVQNEYNELGALVTKKLHSRNGTTFAQDIDYRYNIKGWLEKINDATAPAATDLFSMNLQYHNPTSTGGDAQFNGNISEMKWSTTGQDNQAYGYYYDGLNRLKEARYYNINRPTTHNGRYTEKLGDGGSRPGYDLNGNILNLFRYGKKDTGVFGLMDDLRYTYSGNQLGVVNDAIATGAAEEGFKELVETTGEYTYDFNGNMNKDSNKGLTSVTYNHLNLPVKVSKSATDYVLYTYDASGRKLFQQLYVGNVLTKTTDYLSEYIYENNALQFVSHEEGRIVADNSPGAPRPWEYQYYLKDHLGSIRLTFSEKTTTTTYSATLENATQTQEQADFKNYSRNGFTLYNHTPGAGDTYSQLLTGGTNGRVGLAKSFEVNAGDVFDISVYAKFEASTTTASPVTTLLAGLTSAFSLGSGGTGLESTQAQTAFNNVFVGGGPWIDSDDWEDANAPKAYLNYILFDENFVLQDLGFDQISISAQQAGATPVVPHDLLSIHAKVKKKGYIYIYLSNEHPYVTNVYFDDMSIVRRTAVEQANDYYAFGLQFNSFNKAGIPSNRFGYNGKERQNDFDLTWLDYGVRMYILEIGRWNGIDPKAESYESGSPYAYAFDNPIRFIDIGGQDPGDVVVIFDGADLSSLMPPGNGQSLADQIQVNGGNVKAYPGQFWDTKIQDDPHGPYYSTRRLDMNSEDDMDMATQAAYDYIKENKDKDGRVVIYGYSWGGVLANHLAKRLEEDKIEVDFLILVDAANGDRSDQIDRTISENVKRADVYYNPDPTTNFLKSHGHAGKAKNELKTTVNNTIKITFIENGKKKKVTHSNIDEATFKQVMKSINAFLNKK